MSTLGGNDQFTTMGQVTDNLVIVMVKNREKILCISGYTYLKKTGISVQNVSYYVQICTKLTKLLPF